METKKIYILSHNCLYADSLKSLLSSESKNSEFYSSCFSEIGYINNIEKVSPHIIILDFAIINKEAIAILTDLKSRFVDAKILILIANGDQKFFREARNLDIDSYVYKSSPKEILLAAIKILLNGSKYFDSNTNNGNTKNDIFIEKQAASLSLREHEIINLIKEGLSTKDIADRLNLSFHTVETHRKNIYNKLGINKVTDLIRIVS